MPGIARHAVSMRTRDRWSARDVVGGIECESFLAPRVSRCVAAYFYSVATPVGLSVGASSVPPHRAFFEALGVLPEGSAEWRAALAGLVTLRYLDAWADTGATAADLTTERRAVEDAIAVLPANVPERIYLGGLVDASTDDRAKDLTRVVSLLLAYGRALQRRGGWALAADVFVRAYRACGLVTQQPVQRELATSALLRVGQCYQQLGDHPAAERAYQAALMVGREAGDDYIVLRARAAIARLDAECEDGLGDDPRAGGLGNVVTDRVVDVARAVEPEASRRRASSGEGAAPGDPGSIHETRRPGE
jgi:hypothetical protein